MTTRLPPTARDHADLPAPELPRPVGVGGGLGAVQVRMLHGLRAGGISPDFVVGTSVGAQNGAVLAAHPDDAPDRLSALWRGIKRDNIFSGNLFSALWTLGRTHTHLVEAAGLAHLIARSLDVSTFAELRLPFGAVAVNMATGRDQDISDGPLMSALLASSAIPGVFPSVLIDNQLMVDGGFLAHLPVAHASSMGPVGTLVLLDCTVPTPTVTTSDVAELIMLATRLQFRDQLRAALPAVTHDMVVISLPPPRARPTSIFDFDQIAALIEDSRAVTVDFLATLRARDPGLIGDPFTRYLPGADLHVSATTQIRVPSR